MPPQSEIRRLVIDQAKSVVVKVGTRVITSEQGQLDRDRIECLAAQLCRIADSGRQPLMVSSGAVGAGAGKLGLSVRPTGLAQLQAVAAIGQTDLIRAYEVALSKMGWQAAQVLLTATDLRRRGGYLNVRNALSQINHLGAIAIINENDSVAVSELMTSFGDNDRLASQVAGLLPEAMLVILSDVDGLYDGPPSSPNSTLLDVVPKIDDQILSMAQTHQNDQSRGGMASKLQAAKTATSHGHPTIIAPGRDDKVLDKILAGETIGTLFLPPKRSIRGRKRWISSSAGITGSLIIDAGAISAVSENGGSLLAIGIVGLKGSFSKGSVVSIEDSEGNEIARGLSNYPSSEIKKIMGLTSELISNVLGHRPYECVIHRDNLVLSRD
ncbi:glutamate 5-kinase [Rhodopirellula sp.]|nr:MULTISPECIES: glutamate 5-kinase [Pirellulaceae]MDB4338709.1 glutamate 5-kinase [Rubripirellula sp.]MDB4679146.1 glutamate 5-kinase [Rhodopirellula sp.]